MILSSAGHYRHIWCKYPQLGSRDLPFASELQAVGFLLESLSRFCLWKTRQMCYNPYIHRHFIDFGWEPSGSFSVQSWISFILFLEQSQGLALASTTHQTSNTLILHASEPQLNTALAYKNAYLEWLHLAHIYWFLLQLPLTSIGHLCLDSQCGKPTKLQLDIKNVSVFPFLQR